MANCNLELSLDCNGINCDDPRESSRWYLTEKILAYIWDDIFQRLVVYFWIIKNNRLRNDMFSDAFKSEIKYRSFDNIITFVGEKYNNNYTLFNENGCEDYKDKIKDMITFKNDYPYPPFLNSSTNYDIIDADTGAVKKINIIDSGEYGFAYFLKMIDVMAKDPCVSEAFKRERLLPVVKFFEDEGFLCEDNFLPIYFVKGNGYDYILSNEGIEFVIPDIDNDFTSKQREEFQERVYNIYIHRQVGSYALLVPPCLNSNKNKYHCDVNNGYKYVESLHTVRMNNGDNNVEQIQYNTFDYFRSILLSESRNGRITYNNVLISSIITINVLRGFKCIYKSNRLEWLRPLIRWAKSEAVNLNVVVDDEYVNYDIYDELINEASLWKYVNEIPLNNQGTVKLSDFVLQFLKLDPNELSITPILEYYNEIEPKDPQTEDDKLKAADIKICKLSLYQLTINGFLICDALDSSGYRYFQGLTRCWQLPGSVFRRIAHHLPRLKAEIWQQNIKNKTIKSEVKRKIDDRVERFKNSIEKMKEGYRRDACSDEINDALDTVIKNIKISVNYEDKKLVNKYMSNSNDGCRHLFQERLESTLPFEASMCMKGSDNSDINEIYIHSGGLTLPHIGQGPSAKYLLHSWRSGSSANPLFTDSAKTVSCS